MLALLRRAVLLDLEKQFKRKTVPTPATAVRESGVKQENRKQSRQ